MLNILAALTLSLAAADPAPAVALVPLPAAAPAVQLLADPGGRSGLSAGGKPAAFAFADEGQADAVLYPADASKLDLWVFQAVKPAVYHIVCSTGPADGIVHVYVTVGKPAPGPNPKPPGPVVPPQPKPDDVLTARLRAAYLIDAGDPVKKLSDLMDLAELYKQAAVIAADKTKVTTVADLRAQVRDAAANMNLGLASTRAAISNEIGSVMPADGPLTDDSRKKLAEVFAKIASALAAIK